MRPRDMTPLTSFGTPRTAAPVRDRRLLTVLEAAERLGVDAATVRARIRSHDLPSVRVNGEDRVPAQSLRSPRPPSHLRR